MSTSNPSISHDSSSLSGRRLVLWMVLLVCMAMGFRLVNVNRGMWADEFTTYWIVQESASTVVTERLAHGHLPTYFLMIKAWTQLVGVSKFAIRFPGVFISAFAPLLLFLMGRRWFGAIVGLQSAVLLLFNSEYLYMSQSARMYGITAFLEIAALLLLFRDLETATRRRYVGYWITVLLGGLIHLLFLRMAFVVMAILFFKTKSETAFSWKRAVFEVFKPHSLRQTFRYLAPFLVLLVLPPVYRMLQDSPPESIQMPPRPGVNVEASLKVFFSIPMGDFHGWEFLADGAPEDAVRALVIGVTIVLIGFSVRSRREKQGNDPESSSSGTATPRWIVWGILSWGILPALLLMLWQIASGHQIFQSRYIVGSAAPLALLLSLGARNLPIRLPIRRVAFVLVLALTVLFGIGRVRYPGDGLRECMQYWDTHRQPNEKTFFAHYGYWEMNARAEGMAFPDAALRDGLSLEFPTPEGLASQLSDFASGEDSFWILHYFQPRLSLLGATFRELDSQWSIDEEFKCTQSRAIHLKRK